jgi:myo-inositol-1(or 4)-monophosphatase
MSDFKNELRDAAESFAKAGGDSTLDHFRKRVEPEYKEDDTPVTIADRNAEKIIRQKIKQRYPNHGIIGEEFGREGDDRDVVWVLDPIDGTQSFIHGIPFYTTLIGVLINQKPEVGIVYAPVLDEMISASTGAGATLNGDTIHVRECSNLSDATFLTTDVTSYAEYGFEKGLDTLLQETRIHRTWGDAYGHMLVAKGRADIMIDPILSIWDAAALLPILKEAGGSYSDLTGKESIRTGNALSTSFNLKDQIIDIFQTDDH